MRFSSRCRVGLTRSTAEVARRRRLDVELVRRGHARSRQHAHELIGAGRVTVAGLPAAKPATQVDPACAVAVSLDSEDARYVSRGGHKLAGALDQLPQVIVAGRRCLDVGASTGGFTDVLLRRGAAHVVALDVGYGQLAWSLSTDERVTVMDRTNVRALQPAQVAPPPQLVVGDVSFISLTLILPALVAAADEGADHLLMVKPQFEVGKGRVGSGGVVRDAHLRSQAVLSVVAAAGQMGLASYGIVASPLPGPRGNIEYFVWLRSSPLTGAAPLTCLPEKVRDVVQETT